MFTRSWFYVLVRKTRRITAERVSSLTTTEEEEGEEVGDRPGVFRFFVLLRPGGHPHTL